MTLSHPDVQTQLRRFIALSILAVAVAACGDYVPSHNPLTPPVPTKPPAVDPIKPTATTAKLTLTPIRTKTNAPTSEPTRAATNTLIRTPEPTKKTKSPEPTWTISPARVPLTKDGWGGLKLEGGQFTQRELIHQVFGEFYDPMARNKNAAPITQPLLNQITGYLAKNGVVIDFAQNPNTTKLVTYNTVLPIDKNFSADNIKVNGTTVTFINARTVLNPDVGPIDVMGQAVKNTQKIYLDKSQYIPLGSVEVGGNQYSFVAIKINKIKPKLNWQDIKIGAFTLSANSANRAMYASAISTIQTVVKQAKVNNQFGFSPTDQVIIVVYQGKRPNQDEEMVAFEKGFGAYNQKPFATLITPNKNSGQPDY